MLEDATGLGLRMTLTTIGAAGGTTIISTDVVPYDGNALVGKWILLTSGAIANEKQRVTTVSNDTVGTITPVRAFSAQVANGVTFEILDYDPLLYHNAIAEAIRTVSKHLSLKLRDETLIVDNLLLNPDFETFAAGAFTSWASVGTPTLAAETARIIHGSQAAKITATGATEGLRQDMWGLASISFDQLVGKTLHVRGWVWASVASAVRLRVTFDGSTYTNGPWHGGEDEWEGPGLQLIDVAVPADATEMTVQCVVTDGNTGYFDLVNAWIDRITRYTLPTSFYPYGPAKVEQQRWEDKPNGDYSELWGSNYPISGRLLRLLGDGRLTVPTTEAGTVELDEAQAELVVAQAAVYLHRSLKEHDKGSRALHAEEETRWRQEANRLLPHASMPSMSSSRARESNWRTMLDSNGSRYLLLSNGRR